MKKENKKKVVTLSAMAALLAVVLGMGGKTYAKYFSESDAPAQTATVAKWGFVTNAVATNLFPGSDVADRTVVTTENGDVIVRADGTNVVHPGTSGSITFGVNGQAEVKANITFLATSTSEINVDGYYPLSWTLTNNSTPVTEADTDSNGLRLSEVVTYLNNLSSVIEVGQSANYNFELSWTWLYENGTGDSLIENDKKDTLLGAIAEAGSFSQYNNDNHTSHAGSLNVDFGITVSVKQAA